MRINNFLFIVAVLVLFGCDNNNPGVLGEKELSFSQFGNKCWEIVYDLDPLFHIVGIKFLEGNELEICLPIGMTVSDNMLNSHWRVSKEPHFRVVLYEVIFKPFFHSKF